MATDPDDTARATEMRTLRAVAAGDQGAFRGLLGTHGPGLLRFAGSVLGDAAEAEDVVQETFVQLWSAAETWQPRARLRTWLHTVCYNRCIDRLRARKSFADVAELDSRADEAPHPDGILLAAEAATSLSDAIAALPPRQRTAIALFHFEELPQADCAAIMQLSGSAFESLLARARRQLRTALAGTAGEEQR